MGRLTPCEARQVIWYKLREPLLIMSNDKLPKELEFRTTIGQSYSIGHLLRIYRSLIGLTLNIFQQLRIR